MMDTVFNLYKTISLQIASVLLIFADSVTSMSNNYKTSMSNNYKTNTCRFQGGIFISDPS